MVRQRSVWRVQPWQHRLDARLHCPRLDYDSRCRFLLLRSLAQEERPEHDLPQYDVCSCGIIPGMLIFLHNKLSALTPSVVVLLGIFARLQRWRQPLHRRP